MGFIFRKRINLGNGFGLNISKSGISSSVKTGGGTIGTKGFSIKTGLPGFYYRGNLKKGGCASLLLIFGVFGFVFTVLLYSFS